MKAGIELDALVAEKVMGIEPWPEQNPLWGVKAFRAKFVPHGQKPDPCQAPEYSTEIAAAWKITDCFEVIELRKEPPVEPPAGTRWRCTVNMFTTAYGETAAHAICLAALKSVGALPENKKEAP